MSDYLTRLRGVAKDLEWKSEGGASVDLHRGMKSWLGHDIADAVDEIDRLRAEISALRGAGDQLAKCEHGEFCEHGEAWWRARENT